MPLIWHLRAAVATLVGVLAVHQGRYLFAPGAHKHDLSAAHAYISLLGPLAAVLLALAGVQLLTSAASGRAAAPALPSRRVRWVIVSALLLHVFAAQECLETYFAHGYVPHLGELLGEGGWTAVPLAIAVGGAITLLLSGAALVVRAILARRAIPVRRASEIRLQPSVPLLAMRDALSRRLAARGPPVPAPNA